jgi:phosphoenolpyruvate carboxykinase (ATP)
LSHEPAATFEACFAAPFLPLPAVTYAKMLRDKLERHGTRVFLLNTGWSGGPFGVGSRIKITWTRAMVRAALEGKLDDVVSYTDERFGLRVPAQIAGVPDDLMRPRSTWADPDAYDQAARQLADRFVENFAKFGQAATEMAAAGPQL